MSLLGCELYDESAKGFETATLTIDYSADDLQTSDNGSATATWERVTSGTMTKTWTRAAYEPTVASVENGGIPDAGTFWCLVKCCCWKCRFDLFTNDEDMVFPPAITQTFGAASESGEITYNDTITDYSGSTTTDTGSIVVSGNFHSQMLTDGTTFCASNGESGRVGQPCTIGGSAPSSPIQCNELTCTYEDSAGGSGSALQESGTIAIADPTGVITSIEMPSCDDSITAYAQTSYTGSTTVVSSGVTITNTSTITFRVTFSIG